MKNYIQEGERLTWTNATGADVASGDPVVVGNIIGVATGDIAAGASGVLATEGVFELPKVDGASGHAIGQGETMLFDISTGKFDVNTATAAAGDLLGGAVAHAAAASTATTVYARLCGAGAIQSGV